MNRPKLQAFTLTELLCSMAILALAISLALPALHDWSERTRQQGLQDELLIMLRSARAWSVGHNLEVWLCGSSDGQTCDDSWGEGWLLQAPEGQIAPRRFVALEPSRRLLWSRSGKVRFRGGLTVTTNGTFTLCTPDDQPAWAIVLNRQGRARPVTSDDADPARCQG